MDLTVIRNKLLAWFKKYRFVAIVLLAGILFMLIPTGTKDRDEPITDEIQKSSPQLEITATQLESILSQIRGAGRVEVLLTCASGERTVFHADERSSSSESNQSKECETVLLNNSGRGSEALVSHVIAPEYLGAVIVCQGAGHPAVRLAVSEAVSKATGLGSDRISVLQMK